MDIPLDEVIHFDCVTTHPSTGAATDADSTPTFAVYEEATDTDIGVGGNLTKRTSLTGNYRGTFTLSAANGFEVGKWYSVIASATVNSIAGKAVLKNFRVVAAESVAGTPKADVSALGGVAQSATDLKDFADTGYDPATHLAAVDLQTIKTQTVTCAAGVTVPALLASTTNITGGTITTVTNLTNAPGAGDFTATMKTSIGTAVAASAVASVTAGVTLAANQDIRNVLGTLTTTERTAIANRVEAAILDEGDATALLAAIAAKVEEFLVNEGDATATLAAVAAAVRTNLTTELGRIDVAVSSRLATVGYTAPPSAATISTQVASDLAVAHGAGSWATATGFSTHSAADVWTVGTRLLSAGTNIVLAKGTGVTGFNDIAAGAAMTLSAQERLDTADAILGRSVATCEATAAEHSLCTIILATLESSISGTTWTIKRSNGSTTHFAKTVSLDAAATPIIGVS